MSGVISTDPYTILERRNGGESTRLPQVSPGFDFRTRRHMWVEFVVGSRPCPERFFSGYSGFPLSSKTNIFKFHFDPDYCLALYHEPLAWEIAQSLSVLLTLNLIIFIFIQFKQMHTLAVAKVDLSSIILLFQSLLMNWRKYGTVKWQLKMLRKCCSWQWWPSTTLLDILLVSRSQWHSLWWCQAWSSFLSPWHWRCKALIKRRISLKRWCCRLTLKFRYLLQRWQHLSASRGLKWTPCRLHRSCVAHQPGICCRSSCTPALSMSLYLSFDGSDPFTTCQTRVRISSKTRLLRRTRG